MTNETTKQATRDPASGAKAAAKKVPAKKTATKAPRKAPAKSAGTASAATSTARTSAVTASGTKKTAAEKTATKKAAATKKAPAPKRAPDKKVPAKKAPAAKTTARKVPAKKAPAKAARPASLPLPPTPEGSEDWTTAELQEVRAELAAQVSELRTEYERSVADLEVLQRQAADGAGDDQADAGTKTFEREQEMSIAQNKLALLTQDERAIERIDAGTYGRCISCGQPIAKARLQAFPSAGLCVTCKQREERR